MPEPFQFDQIGVWSEIKLEILKEYAAAYSKILAAQTKPRFFHVYIDAFAGAGLHLARATNELVPGSPLNALHIDPPFREYHLIDIKPEKLENLRAMVGARDDVFIYEGDCNHILLEKVFPRVQFRDYRRGLCILDPYGLHLNWDVMFRAGQMKTLDMFLNFPVADMNRDVLWRNPDRVDPVQARRMNAFWGDETWRTIAYPPKGLFDIPEKESNDFVAEAFRQRLNAVAGFKNVPKPIPMRNSTGAVVYYLFFASQVEVAEGIVLDIFDKYRQGKK